LAPVAREPIDIPAEQVDGHGNSLDFLKTLNRTKHNEKPPPRAVVSSCVRWQVS